MIAGYELSAMTYYLLFIPPVALETRTAGKLGSYEAGKPEQQKTEDRGPSPENGSTGRKPHT